jgi:hypothetical protein
MRLHRRGGLETGLRREARGYPSNGPGSPRRGRKGRDHSVGRSALIQSRTTRHFWRWFSNLPPEVQREAKRAYRLFRCEGKRAGSRGLAGCGESGELGGDLANLPAGLFEDYDHVSFLVSGLHIPVSFGDLIQ